MIKYYIDKTAFLDMGVYVSKSTGLLDRPKFKTPVSTDWADMNGTVVDLTRRKYDTRTIKLECFTSAEGEVDFVDKVETFLDLFATAGLHRLRVYLEDGDDKPLIYYVYMADAVSVDKTWNATRMVGKFTLTLIEPEPIKMIVKWSNKLDMTILCERVGNIFTARHDDGTSAVYKGTVSYLGGSKVDITKEDTADTEAVHYTCIYGDIDEKKTQIFNNDCNGTVVWKRL